MTTSQASGPTTAPTNTEGKSNMAPEMIHAGARMNVPSTNEEWIHGIANRRMSGPPPHAIVSGAIAESKGLREHGDAAEIGMGEEQRRAWSEPQLPRRMPGVSGRRRDHAVAPDPDIDVL